MSFPDVSDALWDLTDPIVFKKVVKTVANGQVTENIGVGGTYGGGGFGVGGFGSADPALESVFDGTLQPLPPRLLAMKPEGERSWKWWMLWTEKLLGVDDVLVDSENDKYRVMSVGNWIGGGYREYHLLQDFDDVPAS